MKDSPPDANSRGKANLKTTEIKLSKFLILLALLVTTAHSQYKHSSFISMFLKISRGCTFYVALDKHLKAK